MAALCAGWPAAAIDQVRSQIGVDAAVAQFGVSGQGVIVAVLDRGIDWRNADFRNDDGSTRIAAIFDLTDDSGASAPGNPYGFGTLYTRAQIDAALSGGAALGTRDAVGHGTTTAALAAGNGRNRPDRRYRGIAPRATILVVKITSDGAPAHGSEPAEASFYDPARIPIAIDFVKAKAAELGMPCVMLLNLGSQGGPTDGTSALARKIDSTVGAGKPGIVFVTGTGDDGGMANRAGGTVPPAGTRTIGIQKSLAAPLYFDLWYPESDRFDVTIHTPNGSYGSYPAPATSLASQQVVTADFSYSHLGSSVDYFDASSARREIWIRLDGPTGAYAIDLRGTTVANGRFDATLNPSQFWSSSSANVFTSQVAPGSLWDGSAALNNIAPNSYVIRTSWTDMDGIPRQLVGEGSVGGLWRGSSVGPTFDGRLGVAFSAPGDRVVTTYNPASWWATFRFNLIQGGGGLYGLAGAVSAAAPITTGVIALLLERNPTLDAAQVKQILQETAKADVFTGVVPNASWGHGKIDALAAVSRAGSPPPSILINDTSVAEGDVGTTAAVFTVSLSAASSLAVTVDYATAAGTATSGVDLIPIQGTLVFPPGTTTRIISVPVLGDRLSEGNETFFVNLSNSMNATIAAAQGTGTILDDDPAGFAISDVNVTEPRTGTANAVFTVTLSPAAPGTVTVAFNTTDGTATAPADYTATAGTLTFTAGQTSQTISVPVKADAVADTGDVLYVDLKTSSGPTIVRSRGTATIYDPGFYTVSPCRILDTRGGQGPALSAGSTRTVLAGGLCGVPAGATAVSMNVTVVSPTGAGDLRIFPVGLGVPLVSAINYGVGQTRANNATVALFPGGLLSAFCEQQTGTVDLVVDVNGYFE